MCKWKLVKKHRKSDRPLQREAAVVAEGKAALPFGAELLSFELLIFGAGHGGGGLTFFSGQPNIQNQRTLDLTRTVTPPGQLLGT